jgi:hypothetical protein
VAFPASAAVGFTGWIGDAAVFNRAPTSDALKCLSEIERAKPFFPNPTP